MERRRAGLKGSSSSAGSGSALVTVWPALLANAEGHGSRRKHAADLPGALTSSVAGRCWLLLLPIARAVAEAPKGCVVVRAQRKLS